jgi:hypothetical protein
MALGLRRFAFAIAIALPCLAACGGFKKHGVSDGGTADASMTNAGQGKDAGPAGASPHDAGHDAAPASTAGRDRGRQLLADLKWMIGNKTTTPEAGGDGDAASKCDAVATASAKETDPEARALLEEATALCAFDVPLLTANEALDQLRFTPSQASKLLGCNVARKEIDRARVARPKDPKLHRTEARRGTLCK